MRKIFTLVLGLILSATLSAAPQSLNVVFNGTDNANWGTGNNSTFTVSDGHLNCSMAVQSNNKYRGDLQFNALGDENQNFTLDPSKDIYLAIKFIGGRPDGSIKLEFTPDGSTWYKNQWSGGGADGSSVTTAGNYIYYFQLTKELNYTGESMNVRRMNFIIADAAVEPHQYSIDWVSTFSSLDDLMAYKATKDDGQSDKDEENTPVYNRTKSEGYGTLNDAVAAAATGDVLVLNQDAVITSRINVTGKAVSVIAKTEGATIKANYNGIIFLTTNSTAEITLGGEGGTLTVDGNNLSNYTSNIIEASNGGTVNVKNNVVFKNCTSTSLFGPAICVKNSGKLRLDGVAFENCSTVDASRTPIDGYGTVFIGTPSVSLSGNNSFTGCSGELYIESNYTVATSDLTHTTPIKIMLKDPATRTQSKVLLKCNDPEMFTLQNPVYKFVTDGDDLSFDISTQIDATTQTSFRLWFSESGDLMVETPEAQTISILGIGGNIVRIVDLLAGSNRIVGLSRGVYLIGGQKVMIR